MSSGKEFQEFRRRRFKNSGEGVSRIQEKKVQEFRGRSFKSSGEGGSRVQGKEF